MMTGDDETMIVTLDVRTVAQACAAIGIGRGQFYKLAAYGDIRTIKLSGKTCITKGELERFRKQRTITKLFRDARIRRNKETRK